MNTISFPGLNLNLNINRIAIKIGSIEIYSYAICIVVAILVSFLLLKKCKEKYNIDFDFTFYTIIYCLIFGIFGARIYYVLFNLNYYIQNPIEILNLRSGGLAIYGGLIAGLIVIYIRCKKEKINMYNFLDYIIPFVAIGQSIGRWGNFFNIEAYGISCQSILRMGIQTTTGYLEVHPVFFYEACFTFLIFLFLRYKQKNREFEGEIVLTYLMLYSFVRFFLENLRIDSLMFFSLRISVVVSIVVFVISLVIYFKEKLKCRKMSKKAEKDRLKKTAKAVK